MIIRPIYDMELIESTMKLSYIWPHIHDDSTTIDTFQPVPPDDNYIQYLGVFNPDYVGFFMLVKLNAITYEVHTVLTKAGRGHNSVAAAKSVIEWIFTKTECERLVTQVPADNTPAERLSIAAGMALYGINEHSFRRDNIVQSMKLYGITKG